MKPDDSARAEALAVSIRAAQGDSLRLARLLVEQALIEETSFAPAYASYRAAAEASPDLLAAVSGARRTADDPRERLAWLEREVALRDPSDRPFLLVEKARALDASGAEPATRVAAWEEARLASPDDDAALEGLLRALIAEGDRPALARHHARLARGVSRELAAAHLVVRGRILEGLGEDSEAAVAYREALALSDVPGPAREGLVRVLRRLRGFGELRALLIEDGDRATERAARVRRFYEAARLSDDRLEDPAAAVSLLRRAHADAGDDPALDARVIEELCRLLEEQGDTHGAAAARRARIAYERLPAMRALEERRLARELEALSDLSGAVEAWERARALEPLDDLSRTTLDRLLATLGRDELRLALWIDEAKRAKDAVASAQAYVRAAAIADGALARPDEALRLLGAAWATRPGDEDALDAQTRILGRAREIRDAASVEKAVDLLEHASDLTTDVALRVAHLERAAQLAEDVDFDRAVALWERALALSPTRRFALAGLTRALHRAGAHAALARVLSREAEQTTDLEHATALRVRAAEVYQRDARDLERAVATLRRVLELKPDHQGALQLLLSCHEEAGRAEDARAVLRTLLTLRPDDAVLLLAEIAEVSRRQGDLAGCIEALEAILARVPGHEVATIDLARALRRAGRFREAAERTLDPVLAGELFEGRVGDDARAEELFLRAGDADGVRRVHERRPRLLPELGAGLAGGLERLSVALREGHLSTVLAECFPAIDDARARVRGFEMRFALAPDVEAARALVADRGARERLLRSPEDAAFAWSILGESERSTVWASSLARALLLEGAEALASARAALVLDGASPTAIARVIELSTALGDREAMLLGHRRAADIASEREARVQHLLAAAEAARAIAPDDAVALIDAALAEDPESLAAATAATQLLIGADAGKLAELLARAAFAANRQDRVVALSREAAALKEALGDPARACALLDRARAVDPNNVAVLVELGEALRTREAWGESARVLELAVGLGSESQHREWLARAHRALADLHEGPLADPLKTIIALRAVMHLVPSDLAVRRRLARVLGEHGQPIEADAILTGLLVDPGIRLTAYDDLCALRLAQHDRVGAERALRERLECEPSPEGESFARLSRFHQEHLRGDESLADSLAELVVSPRADTSWLLPLASLELRLGRERAAIVHLQMAARMLPDDRPPLLLLAAALSSIAEHDEAARVLDGLFERDPTQAEVLAQKEKALLGVSAQDEASVVAELRAWLGQIDGTRYRARRSLPSPARETALDEGSIDQWIAPRELDRGALRTLRVLGRVGSRLVPAVPSQGPRERLAPRSGHPLRTLVDRLAALLGLEKIEVALTDDDALHLEPTDPPALLVPRSMLAWPELEVAFTVARALARVSTGALLAEKLGPIDTGKAIAAAAALHGGTLAVIDAQDVERRLARALDRNAHRALEAIGRTVGPFDPEALARGVEHAAARIGYLLTGDLGSALTAVRRVEPSHVAEVGQRSTITGDLIRFALTPEAIALRRRLGTLWTEE